MLPERAPFWTIRNSRRRVISFGPCQRAPVAGRRRCALPHRDFNTGNILFRGSGQAFGLDFQNEDREPALRDALFFVEDAFVQLARAERLETPVRKLWGWFMAGYGSEIEDDAVIPYFQMSFALSAWAKIGHARVPTTNDRLRLRFAKALAL